MKHSFSKLIVQFLKLSLLLVVLIMASCDSKKNSEERDPNAYYATIEKSGNQNVVVCDVSKINRKVKFPLSKLVKNCEIIHLETTDASLLPELRRHAISENYVCVAGFEGPVKLFKRDGSFICDIGKLGRGPGEYGSTPYQILLKEKSNSIFLLPPFNIDKILWYDLKGDYVKSIPLLYKSAKAKFWIEGDTITITSMVFDDLTPVVYQQTFDGKLIQKLPIIKNLTVEDYSSEIFSSNTNSFDFQITSIGTLFHYNPIQNILEPKLIFSPFPNSAGQILRELPDYYFGISYVKQGNGEYKSYDVLIDKKTLKASLFELTNDYYGGIPINGIIGSWGMFSSSLPAFKLMEEINKILKENKPDIDAKRKLQNILSQLHENNNDVMFVGRL